MCYACSGPRPNPFHGRASTDILRIARYFNQPPPSSIIPSLLKSGLRSDIFLCADASAISSIDFPPTNAAFVGHNSSPDVSHLVSGYINAVDASHDLSKIYEHGFKGVLKVHPVHMAATFYHRLIPRDEEDNDTNAKQKEPWWRYMQSWEYMYDIANGGKSGRFHREGGVYPPKSTFLR